MYLCVWLCVLGCYIFVVAWHVNVYKYSQQQKSHCRVRKLIHVHTSSSSLLKGGNLKLLCMTKWLCSLFMSIKYVAFASYISSTTKKLWTISWIIKSFSAVVVVLPPPQCCVWYDIRTIINAVKNFIDSHSHE